MKRTTRFARSLAFSIGLLSGGLAAAAPTVTYFGGLALGIQDLVVSGTNYDVSFRFGSYDTVFASDAPTFIGDSVRPAPPPMRCSPCWTPSRP
ncbi:MAG: hypothetical protein KGL78_02580 [Burkholderiales bacterium]|nr:hypothetical protein [Burkholderiales bacterium]